MFQKEFTEQWTKEHKRFFAAVFYHLRGYFIDFMWYMANFTNDEEIKKIILHNIQEELGFNGRKSHEQLYAQFAEECDVDIHDELVNKTHYLPFAKQFNKEHIDWLSKNRNDDSHLAAFAAYERLDNIDYPRLTQLAGTLKLSKDAIKFFQVHMYVEHFESTLEPLQRSWEKNPDKVKEAFNFIYTHQLNMWEALSESLLAYN